jgi:hypothetical protein
MGKNFNAGGWGGIGRYQVQRVDQGQDFEIELNGWITAPGDGEIIAHSSDAPFPNGFGDPYAVVRITNGRFAIGNGEWYVGHANRDVQPVGTKLKLGSPIARANNSLYAGWGWCELGKWDGGPHSMGEGALFAGLFTPLHVGPTFVPLKHGSRGIRVVKITRRLAYLHSFAHKGPYLRRWFYRFRPEVVDAVEHFQRDHKMADDGIVGPHTFDAIQRAFESQRRHRR